MLKLTYLHIAWCNHLVIFKRLVRVFNVVVFIIKHTVTEYLVAIVDGVAVIN